MYSIPKRNNLRPHLHGSFMFSNDRQYEEKATEIISFNMNSPQNAVFLCVGKRTQIQALDRLQPNLPLKPGRPERRTFEYKRHVITNLFVAFNSAYSEVIGKTGSTRNRIDFIDFLNKLARKYGRCREFHLILDNLSIYKITNAREWLEACRNWHFHFTPTYSSSQNQINIRFSPLSRPCIHRGVFRSVRYLISEIKIYIDKYYQSAKLFQWTTSDTGRRIAESNAVGHANRRQRKNSVGII